MKKLLPIIFLLTTLQTFGQFDYELFQQYADKSTRQQNISINSVTELQLQDNGKWTKTLIQQFNNQGLPTMLIQLDQQGGESEKKEFIYDTAGQISKIEYYKGGNHFSSTEFKVNEKGQITSYSDYVYSSLGGEKMDLWKTYLEYNSNKTLKKIIKTQSNDKDTTEINFYDTLGVPTKSLWHQGGLRTTKIEYVWSKDRTEMKEMHYENDTSIYTTVIHKYKDNKEIEKTDPSTSPKPFYWKYDKSGRVIETNEAFFYILYFTYDNDGRLASKTMNVLFSDSDEKDLPKKIQFKYEYQLRK
ncbi:hypothetical protein [Pelobium manganitolerans]|uniref:hypothetical protein n=1 Tax=Pelobium manganitolerans TaxID=1842495 RepID=UPI003FA3BD5D